VGPVALAYTFGLRHALDADHIAAIDNVRFLMALADCRFAGNWLRWDKPPGLLERFSGIPLQRMRLN
jgi:hypothetical protein